jgi:hypothetical protein
MIVAIEGLPAQSELFPLFTTPYIIQPQAVGVAGNVITWTPPPATEQLLLKAIPAGAVLRVRVTLKGPIIWGNSEDGLIYLDGQVSGQAGGARFDGNTRTELKLPSGSGDRASDFESWFWLASPAQALLRVSAVEVPFTHTNGEANIFPVQNPTVLQHPPPGVQAKSIHVTFAGATLDPGTVKDGTTFIVQVSAAGRRRPVRGRITFPPANTVLWTLATGVFEIAATYTVTLKGTGTNVIKSQTQEGGLALDGRPNTSFPSGSGNPGGDFSFSFIIPD